MLPSHVKVLNPKKKEGASAAGASAGAGAANPSLMAPGARDPEGFVEPERILHRVGALASKWPSKRTLPTGGGLHNLCVVLVYFGCILCVATVFRIANSTLRVSACFT